MNYELFADIAGGKLVASGNVESVIWTLNNSTSLVGTSYPKGTSVVLTGWGFYSDNAKDYYMQLAGNGSQYILFGEEYGWTPTTISNTIYTQNQTQQLINKLIANNKYILENNLVCARFASKLSADDRNLLDALQTRLVARNNALLNDELLSSQSTSYPLGYANLGNYLASIGVVISSTAIIVVSAIVVAALSTAAYFAYLAFYNESADDVKFSQELTKRLQSSLTEEDYNTLLEETQGIVTKARLKEKLQYAGSTFTTLGLFLLGGFVVTQLPKWIANFQKK